MAKRIEVPDSVVEEVEALVKAARETDAKRARIAELEAELARLKAEVNGSARRPRDRRHVTDAQIIKAIRGGASNATLVAAELDVSVAAIRARIGRLVDAGRVTTTGERRSRRLSVPS